MPLLFMQTDEFDPGLTRVWFEQEGDQGSGMIREDMMVLNQYQLERRLEVIQKLEEAKRKWTHEPPRRDCQVSITDGQWQSFRSERLEA